MKNYLVLLCIMACCLFSCNDEAPNATTGNNTPTTLPENGTLQNERNQTPINFNVFEAKGSEPAWSLTARKEGAVVKYDLELDYGETKLSGSDGEFRSETNTLLLNTERRMLTVQLLREPCADTAGNPHDTSVSFTVDGRKYVGCGDFK